MSQRRRLSVSAVLIALAAIAWFARDRRATASSRSDTPRSHAAKDSALSRLPASRPFRADAPAPSVDWFTPPDHVAPGVYKAEEIPLEWDVSCANLSAADRSTDFSSLLVKRSGLSGSQQFPRDVHVVEISQFWSHGSHYLQLSAIWEEDEPPSYRFEHYEANDPSLAQDVRTLPIPGLEGEARLDAESMLSLIDARLKAAVATGAVEGRRILSVSALTRNPGASADERPTLREARFSNSTPTAYEEPGLSCRLNASGRTARCRCPDPREDSHDD